MILLTIPHRYDMLASSHVNLEVKKFNRKLGKYMKTKNHATVLETECNTQYYTKNGLHLNGLGKEVLTKQIAAVTENLFHQKKDLLLV